LPMMWSKPYFYNFSVHQRVHIYNLVTMHFFSRKV
jgi:hypothetical protein